MVTGSILSLLCNIRGRVDDLAALAGTIPYELTCAVSKRVPRVYVRGGKIVGTELRLYLE